DRLTHAVDHQRTATEVIRVESKRRLRRQHADALLWDLARADGELETHLAVYQQSIRGRAGFRLQLARLEERLHERGGPRSPLRVDDDALLDDRRIALRGLDLAEKADVVEHQVAGGRGVVGGIAVDRHGRVGANRYRPR